MTVVVVSVVAIARSMADLICGMIYGVKVQEAEPDRTSTPYSFVVVSVNRCLVLAAGSADEKDRWMEDITAAAAAAADREDDASSFTAAKITYPSLKSNSGFYE